MTTKSQTIMEAKTAEAILDNYSPNREYPSYYHEAHVLSAMSEYRSDLVRKEIEWVESLKTLSNREGDSTWTKIQAHIEELKLML